MPYLVSDSTMRQLYDVIAQRSPGASSAVGARASSDLGDTNFMPFDMFWCASAEKFRVYLPAGCCIMGGLAAAIDSASLTEVDGLPDWYDFSAPGASGDLFAVGKKADSGSLTLAIEAGTETTPAKELAGLARIVASVTQTGGRWQVVQLWRGAIGGTGVPDALAVSGQRSLTLGDAGGFPVWQIYGFQEDETVAKGLQDCLTVDTETGAVTATEDTEQYEILVRVKSADGTTRTVAYMPIGKSSGKDPGNETGDGECAHETPPGGGAGGGGGAGWTGDDDDPDGRQPPGGETSDTRDRDHNNFPSKVGPCW